MYVKVFYKKLEFYRYLRQPLLFFFDTQGIKFGPGYFLTFTFPVVFGILFNYIYIKKASVNIAMLKNRSISKKIASTPGMSLLHFLVMPGIASFVR